jgi:hypothetical protein
MPGGKHHHGPIAVDEDQTGEGRAVRTLQLDAGRRSRSFAHPGEQGLGASGMPNAPPDLSEDDLADELG